MNQELLVTIIVLTYKNFEGLERTLRSVINQTYLNVEIIVSDDGSENFKEEMFSGYIEEAKKQNKVCKVRHNLSNQGTVKNINNALEMATGDIIGFLGCGDFYVSERVLEKMVSCFAKENVEVVAGKLKGVSVTNPDKITVLPEKNACRLLKKGDHEKILSKMFNDNLFCAPATFYKKEVYDKYGKYDERMRLIEDYPFMFKLVLNHANIFFWDTCVTEYLFDGVSSGKRSPMIEADTEKIKKLVILPCIDQCRLLQKRLFLYNYSRKSCKGVKVKIKAAFKYPDQFVYWQYRRISGWIKMRRRR